MSGPEPLPGQSPAPAPAPWHPSQRIPRPPPPVTEGERPAGAAVLDYRSFLDATSDQMAERDSAVVVALASGGAWSGGAGSGDAGSGDAREVTVGRRAGEVDQLLLAAVRATGTPGSREFVTVAHGGGLLVLARAASRRALPARLERLVTVLREPSPAALVAACSVTAGPCVPALGWASVPASGGRWVHPSVLVDRALTARRLSAFRGDGRPVCGDQFGRGAAAPPDRAVPLGLPGAPAVSPAPNVRP